MQCVCAYISDVKMVALFLCLEASNYHKFLLFCILLYSKFFVCVFLPVFKLLLRYSDFLVKRRWFKIAVEKGHRELEYPS